MIYKTYTIGGELYHHGILGQKHGVRNGPPYPLSAGDHSASEKKAGWRKSLKAEKNEWNQLYHVKKNLAYAKADKRRKRMNSKNPIDKIFSRVDNSREKRDHLVEELNRIEKMVDEYNDKVMDLEDKWFETKERKAADKKAYDETYKWFKENEPEYLETIIKNNGGSRAGLDGFHDFRKVYEGWQDELWGEGFDAYLKKHPIKM